MIGATGEGGSGVAYVFDSESFAQRSVLKPSAAAAVGFFGQLSAISGDTIVVTAFNGTAGLTSGAVYVYEHTQGDEFVQRAALQASNASGGDFFGVGVALAGDTLVVGAAHEGSGARGIDGDLSAPGLANSARRTCSRVWATPSRRWLGSKPATPWQRTSSAGTSRSAART